MDRNIWESELNEYLRQSEPDKAEKSNAWKTAIGLQDVDGLQVSDYLLNTAKAHIEGKINISEADRMIRGYYEAREARNIHEDDTKEADLVSARITMLLNENTFVFSPAELRSIHKKLFVGVFDHAGKFRDYNITKKEWVLNGGTVTYSSFENISETLEYDFNKEKNFSYEDLSPDDAVKHLSSFVSGIWQIHPFGEGNTRTTAVFLIRYLKTFGFRINNDIFAANSWYFRNALVRANYNDWQNGIHETTVFLEHFLENLLLNKRYELKNRVLHIDYMNKSGSQSAETDISKCQNDTLNISLEESVLLKLIRDDPSVTQKRLSELTGKSERTIKRRMTVLQEKGIIKRENGKRNGKWVILVEQ